MTNILGIINKKVEKQKLTADEIEFFVNGYTRGEIPDYQMSSLLMAIVLNGMDEDETFALTDAMLHSGEVADLSKVKGITVDKHSTGGVGDSTTIALAPILACCGVKVAKMSGRGLGWTGGTLDKLESIPNFNVNVDQKSFCDIVNNVGCCIIGQTANLVPADKKLYALRDVTGTTRSMPLMASSIMSKKLASGAKNILLDVKFGTGAFMSNLEDAVALAEEMVKIGLKANRNIGALVTDMSQPLSDYVGNSLEVVGIVKLLNGEKSRLYDENKEVAVRLLGLCGVDRKTAETKFDKAISSGKAKQKLIEMVYAQGGDASYVEYPEKFGLGRPVDLTAPKSGYVYAMKAANMGLAVNLLGGGRMNKDDGIDHGVGFVTHVHVGDKVKKGDKLITVYVGGKNAEEAEAMLLDAVEISSKQPEKHKIAYAYVGKDGTELL